MTRDDFKIGQEVWMASHIGVEPTKVTCISTGNTKYDIKIEYHKYHNVTYIAENENYLIPCNSTSSTPVPCRIYLTKKEAINYYNQCIYNQIELLQQMLIKS